MRLARPKQVKQAESTIALINIVFLMLIFFLIAGTLAPPADPEVALIATADAEKAEPPDALFVTADGTLRFRGEPVTVAAYLSERGDPDEEDAEPIRLAADRELPAEMLIDIVAELRAAGAGRILVVTERAGH